MATGRGQLWWREGDRARPHTPLQQVTLGISDFLFPWLPHPGKAQMGKGGRPALCKPVPGNSHPYLLLLFTSDKQPRPQRPVKEAVPF